MRSKLVKEFSAIDLHSGGMLMPGRKYTAPNSSYRYGFNGQEKSTEIDDNLTTAEFWEYDSRIGRRWNLDPTPDISLSPYATFGNNPILNIDPYGDTLSNPQLRDAAKIASTEIKKRIDNNQGFGLLSKNYLNPLNASITNYVATNKITGQDQVDFYSNVQAYYSGYADVGMMSKGDFMQLNRLINNAGVGDARALRLTQASINYNHSQLLGILNISANVAVGEAAGAIGTPVGARPKGPQPRLPFAANSSVPLVEYNGGMSYIYRGDNGSSPLFQLKGGEYKYSDNAIRGLSLHVDAPKLTNARGASYKVMDMPTGLKIVQQGKDLGHFEIVPTSNITQDQFQTLLNKIKYIKN